MKELAGRVAVITGGAGGIGKALGARVAEEGMRVVLADVFPEPLEEAVAELRTQGHDVTGVVTGPITLATKRSFLCASIPTYVVTSSMTGSLRCGAGAHRR